MRSMRAGAPRENGIKQLRAWALRAAGVLVTAVLAAGATGCVETSLYEKAALDLDGARRDNAMKEQQIRALQWQLASVGQQMQALTQQDAAALKDLERRMQEVVATNRDLAERMKAKEQEAEKLALDVARAEEEASSKRGPAAPTARLRPEDLRRIEAAASAHDPEVTKLLARVEKILNDRAHTAPPERSPRMVDSDLIDPWNGERK